MRWFQNLFALILQKLLRIKQIEDNQGKTIISEGIDANYLDIVNYGIFSLIHLNLNKNASANFWILKNKNEKKNNYWELENE